MATHKRKIQYVAGTTYSISLPKQWIQQNNIKAGDELLINETTNKTLHISQSQPNQTENITLDITDQEENLSQIIYSVYYLGVETICLTHKKEFSRATRLIIRKTISELSGTEIIHEDENKFEIKVLLDKSKIDLYQLFYRLHLIISSEFDELLHEANLETIMFYEKEINRIYHLCAKIIKMSLTDTNVLASSKIENIQFIPGFFLISKRLENISDNIEFIAKRMERKNISSKGFSEPIQLLKAELQKGAKKILRMNKKEKFSKIETKNKIKIEKIIRQTTDESIRVRLGEIKRYIINIQDELVSLTFYKNQEKIIN